MGPAIASDSPADARSPQLTGVRTGLGADAIAAALIENLHRLQGKLPCTRRATTALRPPLTPFATA
jgi:starch phosphorylase